MKTKIMEILYKYSVLTYIFGDNYECVHEIKKKNDNIEYILITDNKNITSDTWNIIYDSSLDGLSVFDKCYQVRFHPFSYVNTDYVLRLDGSIEIKSDLIELFEYFENSNNDLMLLINPVFSNLLDDYNYWVKHRNYPILNATKCKEFLLKMNYNNYKGYFLINCVLLKKCKITGDIDNLTYSFLRYLGDDNIDRFDQPIYSFVINKFFENEVRILPVGEDLITNSKYLQWYFHNSDTKVPVKNNIVEPYLFNEKIKIEQFYNGN